MKIENVIKKFNLEKIYSCPKCLSESHVENISLVCGNNHRYDFSKKGYIHLINNYKHKCRIQKFKKKKYQLLLHKKRK